MDRVIIKTSLILSLVFTSLSCSADKNIIGKYTDGISLTLIIKPFVESQHKVKRCGKRNVPCYIDGKIFYGGMGKLPIDKVVSLVFERDGKQQTLDVSSIYNPGITNSNITKRFNVQRYLGRNTYRVIGYFGPEKRPYIAHWLVREDGSIRNHLSDFESLNSLIFEVKKDLGVKY